MSMEVQRMAMWAGPLVGTSHTLPLPNLLNYLAKDTEGCGRKLIQSNRVPKILLKPRTPRKQMFFYLGYQRCRFNIGEPVEDPLKCQITVIYKVMDGFLVEA